MGKKIEKIHIIDYDGFKHVSKFKPTERNIEMLINKINELTDKLNELTAE
jgi:hypothetical protein